MRISVITPTYNRSHFLKQAIESFLMQNYEDKEMIVVDDGSQDSTKQIVSMYDVDMIKYIYQTNQGQPAAQNNGIRNATGDLICTLDDDDLLYDENSLYLRAKHIVDKEIEAVWTSAIDINSSGGESTKHLCQFLNFAEEYHSDRIFINSLMWRKNVMDKVGYFDETLSSNEDWDFKIRLLIHCKCDCIQDITVKHRIHNAMRSTEHRNNGLLIDNEVKLKDKLKKQYGGLFNA